MLSSSQYEKIGRLGPSWCMSDDDPSFSQYIQFPKIYKRFPGVTFVVHKQTLQQLIYFAIRDVYCNEAKIKFERW